MVATLLREGVPIVAGTDAELGGFVLQRELELYVEAGLTPAVALQLATIRAANLMKMSDELGSIGPGKLADLLIVDGDPTRRISEIRRVERVIKNGVLYDSAQLERAVGLVSREASSFRGN
jgi:imidazolonepropionase-like amidohydrolase